MSALVNNVLSKVRGLRGEHRHEFVRALAKDRYYRAMIEDTLDGLLIDERRHEPSRLLSEYLAERNRRKRSRR